jgi:hypothetical protein
MNWTFQRCVILLHSIVEKYILRFTIYTAMAKRTDFRVLINSSEDREQLKREIEERREKHKDWVLAIGI